MLSTFDYVVLLSVEETVEYILDGGKLMKHRYIECKPTEYVKSKLSYRDITDGHCKWWLRTPGRYSISNTYVKESGFSESFGYAVDADNVGVRPAIWVEKTFFDQ